MIAHGRGCPHLSSPLWWGRGLVGGSARTCLLLTCLANPGRLPHDVPMSSIADRVEQLGVPYRAGDAYWALIAAGFDVVPYVRAGLHHPNADVRYHCVRVLDHYLTADVLDDLISMLDDPDERVRCSALHTLACDRCKEGDCRPSKAQVVMRAIRALRQDPGAHARAMAIEVVGQWVHSSDEAVAALVQAAAADTSSSVRKKASWYAPGGAVYVRTAPKRRKDVG